MFSVVPLIARYSNNFIYDCLEWEILRERQRPTVAKFITKEPIDAKLPGFLWLGTADSVEKVALMTLVNTAKLENGNFMHKAVEVVRQWLDAPFIASLKQTTADEVLLFLARTYSMNYELIEVPKAEQRRDWGFIATVRNALDLVWRIEGWKDFRWEFNTSLKKFRRTPLHFNMEAGAIPLPLVKEELSKSAGIVTQWLQYVKPFHLLLWKQQKFVVDSVLWRSVRRDCEIRWIAYE